jgi:hypothetical protein
MPSAAEVRPANAGTRARRRFPEDKSKDARARFLKGVILTEQNKAADAISIFSGLTEDFPELPEPSQQFGGALCATGPIR